ncbi:type II secretion system F family protein [Solirubrobacter soli]|uniref:type II secretion system F family protein n=1 Tax=Solirubrobacter soli TaxID=363832 RepID=UPI000409F5E8|nr:type II secretion system F family protein [Solirubrobacter soli]
MTPAVVLAFGAGAAGVVGAWELLGAVERTRVVAAVTDAVAPVVRAGHGVSPTTGERRRLAMLAAAALAAAGWLVGGVPLALVAAVAGPAAAATLLRARRKRFRAAVNAAAPGVARAFADALSAGHAVRGALDLVAAQTPGPAGHELTNTARDLRLGAPTEAALERLRRKAASPAWDAMVAGILLQRDAGGDLPALLRDLARTLEAAARQDRDAIAATAQARFTAKVVLTLPVGAALLAELAQPGLIEGLFSNPVSAWLTSLALLLQLVALVAVRRLAKAVTR